MYSCGDVGMHDSLTAGTWRCGKLSLCTRLALRWAPVGAAHLWGVSQKLPLLLQVPFQPPFDLCDCRREGVVGCVAPRTRHDAPRLLRLRPIEGRLEALDVAPQIWEGFSWGGNGGMDEGHPSSVIPPFHPFYPFQLLSFIHSYIHSFIFGM